jgi:segregation and condensation protein A
MRMMERSIPWWRKVLKVAWDGVRSGFGLFPRASKTELEDETESIEDEAVLLERSETKQEVESPLSEASPKEETKSAEVESAAVEVRAEEPAAAAEPVAETHAEPGASPAAIEANEAQAEVAGAEPEAPAEEAVEIAAVEEVAADEPEAAAAVAPALVEEPEATAVEAEAEPEAETAVESVEAETAEVVAEAAQETEPEPTMDEPETIAEEPMTVEANAVVEAAEEIAPEPEPEAETAGAEEAAPAEEAAAVPSEEAAAEPDSEAAPDAAAEPTPVAETEPDGIAESDAEAGVALIETVAEEPEVQAEVVLEADPDVTSYEAAAQAAPVDDTEGQAETAATDAAGEESGEASAEAAAGAVADADAGATADAVAAPAADADTAAETANSGIAATAAIEAAPAAAEPPAAEAAPAHPHKQLIKLEAKGDDASPFSILVEEIYDGPLDLLLDLIRKQDIDIYDIPIARITAQFLAYVNQLKAGDVDVAGEFIYTASLLIHIKSKMLLPRTGAGPEEADEDPRRELVDRLLEHERFKNAAQMLQQKQMLEAATWTNPGFREFQDDAAAEPEIAADTVDLVRVFRDILERARNRPVLNVQEDSVTVGQMVQFLVRRLTMEDKPVALRRLLSHTHSERALIAMFLALLELVRMQAILLRQDLAFSEIFIKKNSGFEAVLNQGLANAQDDWR